MAVRCEPILLSKKRWHTSPSYLLNSVAPSLIHDYAKDRYWNSAAGVHGFPFTNTRTGNATMFNSAGQLVWAPANMIANSSVSGAVVGVMGSGGAMPTGWLWSSAGGAAVTREVVAIGPDYIDIRMYGTNGTAATVYPSIFLGGNITAVVGAPVTGAVNLQLIAGSFAGVAYSACGTLSVQFGNSGSYVASTGVSARATSTMTRLSSSGSRATADHNEWRPYVILGLNVGDTCDFTLRISQPQLERTGPDSPKPYIFTNGTACYCQRISLDPHTGATGVLVEATRTNLAPRSSTHNSVTGLAASTGTAALGWTPQRFTADGAASGHFVAYDTIASAPTGSTVYTISAIVKIITGTRLQIAGSSSYAAVTDYVNFNLSNGTVVGTGATVVASSITALGSGYYRISMTFTTIAVPTTGTVCALSCIASDADTRIPSLTSSDVFDVIGVQMELGYGASSFIPTYYAAATRASDILSTTSVSWLTQNVGTWYVKFTPINALDTNKRLMSIGDGTANNAISLVYTTGKQAQIRTAASGVSDFTPTSGNTSNPFAVAKAALLMNSPTKKVALNGSAVASASVAFPTSGYTTFKVGAEADASGIILGHIHEIRYYPSASASDGQLQTLTT